MTGPDDVKTDPNAETFERETSITFSDRDDNCRIYTRCTPMLWRLMDHTEVTTESLTIHNDGAYSDVSPETEVDGDVVGGRFTAPLGLLKFGSQPRKSDTQAKIVSEQEEVTSFE